MSEEPNTTPAARRQTIETGFITACQKWGGEIEAWSVRAAQLKAERTQLDKDMVNISAVAAGELVASGMDAADVEKHLETLMLRAFKK